MYRILFIIIALIASNVVAQETGRTKMNGKICSERGDLEGIYIINIATEETAISNEGGFFSISAVVGDTLMISGIQVKGMKIALTACHFENEFLFIKTEPVVNQLKEVIVRRYDNINAVALGIIPNGQKSYTPAERKLKAASSYDAEFGLNTSFSIDPLLNLLSGRTAMLKKEVEVEKKEFYLKKLAAMFEDYYFINKLKIPSEYVKGFLYYIVENERFITIFKSKNKTMTEFLMGELATKYAEIIANEK